MTFKTQNPKKKSRTLIIYLYIIDYETLNLLRKYTLTTISAIYNNKNVIFSGYRIDHINAKKIEFKIETNGKVDPLSILAKCIYQLSIQLLNLILSLLLFINL